MEKFICIRYISLSFTGILFLLCPLTKAEEPAFPDNLGKIIRQGENYKIRLIESQDTGVKTAEAVFVVKAKPEAVFKSVTDFEHYPEFMPNIVKVTSVNSNNKDKRYRFTLKVAIWNINYTLLLKSGHKDDVYLLEWEYVEGDIRDTSGSWRIGRYDRNYDFSLIRYRVRTDPGRFVPDWVADRLSTRSIPDMIKAVQKRSVE